VTDLGKTLRLGRVIGPQTERSVIVPLDHPVEDPSLTELNDPVSVVASLAAVGPDAFLMRRGAAQAAANAYAGRSGWVQRLTARTGLSSSGIAHGDTRQNVIAGVEEAVRNGADAVCPTFFLGPDTEDYAMPQLGRIADECNRHSMPLLTELFPVGGPDAEPFDGPYTIDEMRLAVRIASEEGADAIKTYYTGDQESFASVLEYAFVPVIIAGGPNSGSPFDTLKMAYDACEAGAAGVAFGRRVWGAENPQAMLRALIRVVRENASPEDAALELEGADSVLIR
jgi:DhnA family fructose-bisphosphate aldolase class Ia